MMSLNFLGEKKTTIANARGLGIAKRMGYGQRKQKWWCCGQVWKGSSRLGVLLAGSTPLGLISSAAGVGGWDLERVFIELRAQPAFSELWTSGLSSVQSSHMASCSESLLYYWFCTSVQGLPFSRLIPGHNTCQVLEIPWLPWYATLNQRLMEVRSRKN